MHDPDPDDPACQRRLARVIAIAEQLTPRLRHRFHSLDEDSIHDAAIDAALDLASGRTAAGAEASPRDVYSAAWRNCVDQLRSQVRRLERDGAWCLDTAELDRDCSDENTRAEATQLINEIESLMPDDGLKVAFRLWTAGERRTAEYAMALGVAHLGVEKQRAEVQRTKDRLRKFLARDPQVHALGRRLREVLP